MSSPNKIAREKIYLICLLFMILWSAWLYQQMVFNLRERLYYDDRLEDFYSKERILFEYDLPLKEKYFLKVKSHIKVPIQKFIFNGNIIKPSASRLRGVIYTHTMYVPEEITFLGANRLAVYFNSPSSLKELTALHKRGWQIRASLYNYRKKFSKGLVAFFPESHIFDEENSVLKFLLACFMFGLSVFFLGKILKFFLDEPNTQINKYIIFLLLPPDIFLTLLYFILFHLKYRVAMEAGYFSICFIIFIFFGAFWLLLFVTIVFLKTIVPFLRLSVAILIFVLSARKDDKALVVSEQYTIFKNELSNTLNITFPPVFKKIYRKIYPWTKKLDFSDKCIFLFIFLMALIVLSSILHIEPVTKQSGNIAYCILVLGVAIKLIKLRKENSQRV